MLCKVRPSLHNTHERNEQRPMHQHDNQKSKIKIKSKSNSHSNSNSNSYKLFTNYYKYSYTVTHILFRITFFSQCSVHDELEHDSLSINDPQIIEGNWAPKVDTPKTSLEIIVVAWKLKVRQNIKISHVDDHAV